MNVILLQDVADLGGKGDIVDVSKGFARNYLLPKKLAMKATAGAIKQADKLRTQRIEAEAKLKAAAEEMAQEPGWFSSCHRWPVRVTRASYSVPWATTTLPKPSRRSAE